MKNFGSSDRLLSGVLVAVPVLPTAVDDATETTFQNETRPGVLGNAHPGAVRRAKGLRGNWDLLTALKASPTVENLVGKLMLVLALG